jgi:hypothetical protein
MPICVPASHTGTQNNQSVVETSFSALSRRSGQQLGFIGQGETAVRSRPIHRLSRQPARDCIGPRQPHQQNASEDWNLTGKKGSDALLRRGGRRGCRIARRNGCLNCSDTEELARRDALHAGRQDHEAPNRRSLLVSCKTQYESRNKTRLG